MQINMTVWFAKGYIASPYWPELEKLINIQKESGTKRARSEARREQALNDYLKKINMTPQEYRTLEVAATRPFYRNATTILIPAHQVYGCLAQAADMATSALRIASREQIRTVLKTSDWHTEKTGPDGVWERFVTVTAGTGAKLSNQRALRSDPYIAAFAATGTLTFSPDIVRPEKVRQFLEFAGREIGIGASRKMDWGRFSVQTWEESV